MNEHYKELTKNIAERYGKFKNDMPDAASAFTKLVIEGNKNGVLEKKTKELIALSIAIAIRCDDCIASHMRAFKKAGGTRKELEEAVAVTLYMGGGPSLMYGTRALEAFDQTNN